MRKANKVKGKKPVTPGYMRDAYKAIDSVIPNDVTWVLIAQPDGNPDDTTADTFIVGTTADTYAIGLGLRSISKKLLGDA